MNIPLVSQKEYCAYEGAKSILEKKTKAQNRQKQKSPANYGILLENGVW